MPNNMYKTQHNQLKTILDTYKAIKTIQNYTRRHTNLYFKYKPGEYVSFLSFLSYLSIKIILID